MLLCYLQNSLYAGLSPATSLQLLCHLPLLGSTTLEAAGTLEAQLGAGRENSFLPGPAGHFLLPCPSLPLYHGVENWKDPTGPDQDGSGAAAVSLAGKTILSGWSQYGCCIEEPEMTLRGAEKGNWFDLECILYNRKAEWSGGMSTGLAARQS